MDALRERLIMSENNIVECACKIKFVFEQGKEGDIKGMKDSQGKALSP